ncbi:kinesin light chain, partial [Rhypophila decipiens]
MQSISFGLGNWGQQVGQNNGTINAEFHLPPERAETPPAPFATIPFSRDPDFVNRGGILDQIYGRCSEPGGRVSLVGLGGVGKSQLAIECAYRVAAEQTDRWIFWIHAGTQARVEEGFRTIADTIKLPRRNQPKADIPQLVYSWLSNEQNGRWVIVLDSADDHDVFYKVNSTRISTSDDAHGGRPFAAYLPQSRNGSILLTTRNKNLAFRLTGRRQNMIDVGPMSPKDALTLLEKKLGSLPDLGTATELIQALDFIPLIIIQAAAYIQARTPRTSLEKYLAEFRESESSKSRLLQYDAGDLRRDVGASNAIFATWQISFDHIRSKRPSAASLLSLMSFFDRQGIPDWVLNTSNISMDAIQGRSVNETGDRRHGDAGGLLESLRRLRIRRLFHRRPFADKVRGRKLNDISNMGGGRISLMGYRAGDGFEDDIAMLSEYCLIDTTENGGTFEMHGLVQLSTRRWLEVYGEQDTFQQQFVERMAASYPTGIFENWEICRSLFAHAEVVLGYQPSGDTVETWSRLLNNGGWYAWSQGRYDIAEQMLSKARKAREKELGREDMATLETISLFALVQKDQGRWKEAESLFVQVMETSSRVLGEEHPDTLTSMANLASTYRNQGRWKEAESLEVQVMET